jgi:ribosomal protein S18 acetylase RimI-like enzyme
MNRDYTIEKAPQDNAAIAEIEAFLRDAASEFLRKLTADDLRELIGHGRFYVARASADGAIAGAIYVRSEGSRHWEIGGAVVAAAHRGSGLAQCLMNVAIVHPYLQERESADRIGRQAIEALVRADNARMKALVARPEFCPLGERKLDPREVKGIGHFPVDADGQANVLAYAFDEKYAISYLKQVQDWRDGAPLKPGGKTVALDIFGFRIEHGADPIQCLLDELD